ncbi:MAG TPA: hypothetical protein DCQ99_05925 [Nitrospinae bacterium]|nr:hypothetical protein [Nitrospinota bacterium]HBA26228.1 hypothetical protein [Nitrospinota bacterium]
MNDEQYKDNVAKVIRGVKVLFVRQIAIQSISLIVNIILARLLMPEDFGIFAIINFFIAFLAIFCDSGLGASLVQKKESLTDNDIATTFTIQFVLSVALTVITFFLAENLTIIYSSLTWNEIKMMQVLSITLIFTSLRTIPMALLERNLEFDKIAFIELCEVILFQGLCVVFAVLGYKVWSFIFALIIKSLTGSVLLFYFIRWKPRFAFDKESARRLFGFGIPYLGTNILSVINAAVTPLFLGAYAGAASVGYITWASGLALKPQQLLEIVARATFPFYSRIQENKENIKKSVEKTILFLGMIIFPFIAICIPFSKNIIQLIYTEKWMPGLGAFIIYICSLIPIFILLVPIRAFSAMGYSNRIFLCSIFTTGILWISSIVCTIYIGSIIGIPLSFFMVNVLGAILIFIIFRDVLRFNVFSNIATSFFVSLLIGCFCSLIAVYINTIISLVMAIIGVGFIYFLIMYKIKGDDMKFLFSNIVKTKGLHYKISE